MSDRKGSRNNWTSTWGHSRKRLDDDSSNVSSTGNKGKTGYAGAILYMLKAATSETGGEK